MPIVKNRLFQPVGVLLSDGRMLYLQSREAVEVSGADLEAPHLKRMLAAEQLMLTEPGTRVSPPPRTPAPALETAEPVLTEKTEEAELHRPKHRRGHHKYRDEDESD